MDPEELQKEIDEMNKEYEKLKEEYEKWDENPRRGFHREQQLRGRKMFKLNTKIASKLIELEKITSGDFQKPKGGNF